MTRSCSFRVDRGLRITSVSEELKCLMGDVSERAIGEPYFYFFPRIYCGSRDAIEKAMDEGKSVSVRDYRILCLCDGMSADISISPLFDRASEVSGAEVALVASRSCLPVREMDQLSSLIDIGKVSATLAHGVRNPLNAIKGAVVYLKRRYGSDETFVEFADIIEEEIGRLDSFITRFLSTSLLRMEKMRIDIHQLLEKVIKITSLQALEHNIRFVRDYGHVPLLEMDPFHMESAILNIVNNSIDAMGSSGTITFRTRVTEISGDRLVMVDICDSGPGMPESALCNTLSPPTGIKREKGRGFGLFISREIIQHHGGNLEIMNTRGSGATVRILLPIGSRQGLIHAGQE